MNAFAKSSLNKNVNSSSSLKPRLPSLTDQMARATACDIFENLKAQGYHPRDIISVSTQLLDLITQHITSQK